MADRLCVDAITTAGTRDAINARVRIVAAPWRTSESDATDR